MLSLLIGFIVISVILWAISYFIPMPPPMQKVFYGICVLIAVVYGLYFICALFGVGGVVAPRFPGLR